MVHLPHRAVVKGKVRSQAEIRCKVLYLFLDLAEIQKITDFLASRKRPEYCLFHMDFYPEDFEQPSNSSLLCVNEPAMVHSSADERLI